MAFNDLFSSARGPGVIGMIMALIVLLGFGLLFMLSFDEGFQGGEKSLASIIRDRDMDIEAIRGRLKSGEEALAAIPRLNETASALNQASARNVFLSKGVSELKAELAERKKERADFLEEWEDYKNQYRAYIRSAAAGTTLPELKTADGKVYQAVEISKVTAIGIHISHKDGLARVDFENLPKEIQDHYQYDKDQMLAEAQRHALVRDNLDKAVSVAVEAKEAADAERKAKDKEAEREKTVVRIAGMEAQANSLMGQIRQLEADIVSAENAATAARAAGRRHLNKSGSLRGELNRKRADLVNLQSEIARLQSSL